MSSDEDFLGARASRPHKAWHGLAISATSATWIDRQRRPGSP